MFSIYKPQSRSKSFLIQSGAIIPSYALTTHQFLDDDTIRILVFIVRSKGTFWPGKLHSDKKFPKTGYPSAKSAVLSLA